MVNLNEPCLSEPEPTRKEIVLSVKLLLESASKNLQLAYELSENESIGDIYDSIEEMLDNLKNTN